MEEHLCQNRAEQHEGSGGETAGPLSYGALVSCRAACCLSPAGHGRERTLDAVRRAWPSRAQQIRDKKSGSRSGEEQKK